MKTFMMTSAAALLIAGSALAQSDWDKNSDGMIDRQEFNAGMGDNTFGTWDADGDGMLSQQEYDNAVEMQDDADSFGTWDDQFGGWDADQDKALSGEEYSTGVFGAFDKDQNDMWSEDESAAWEEDEMRYDATRSGREVSQ
jgi:EF hand